MIGDPLLLTREFPPDNIGDFYIKIEVYQYTMEFECYQSAGLDSDNKTHLYVREGTDNEITEINIEAAQSYIHGSIKWDGCMNFLFDEQSDTNTCLHFCGRDAVANVFGLFNRLYDLAEELIPEWDK